MFVDRWQAGRALGGWLSDRLQSEDLCVLGIPRGGVLVAAAAAEILGAPLDVVVPRKIRAPGHPELAIGALALAGGREIVVLDERLMEQLEVTPEYLDVELCRQRDEIVGRIALYRREWSQKPLVGHTVVIIDDGVATGQTARAAVQIARRAGPKEALVAVPVAPPETVDAFRAEGLRLEAMETPQFFAAVGQFYKDFHSVSDEEVLDALQRSRERGKD